MALFLLFALLVVIIAVFSSEKVKNLQRSSQQDLQDSNQKWINFIDGYLKISKSPVEKSLLQTMLDDVHRQGFGKTSSATITKAEIVKSTLPAPAKISEPAVPIDNATLLLYFGAFLFVASVGLFIALGGASGIFRAFAVLFVMAVMYWGGFWLYQHRPKLRQVGLTFIGIGIVLAPLVGLGFYSYVFNHQHGSAVWFGTSIFCMALYVYALVTIRKPLLSYLLIFTFLSLFESGISLVSAPIYYFGWALAAVGIILQAVNLWKNYWPELKESSRQSSQLLLPLSILTAIVLVPNHGAGQLGVALLLAAAFYGLEASTTKGNEQRGNAIACQVMAIAALTSLSYSLSHSWQSAAVCVLVANILQLAILFSFDVSSQLWQNFSSVLMVSGIAAIILAVQHPWTILATTAGLVLVSIAIWLRQHRIEAYTLGTLSFIALPYIYGLMIAQPSLSAASQTGLGALALLVLLLAYLNQHKTSHAIDNWLAGAQVTYCLSAVIVLGSSYFGSPLLCLGTTIGIVASMVILAEHDHSNEWVEAAGIILAVPLIRGWANSSVLLISSLLVLAILIGLSLRYKKELLRWESTALWLLLPLFFGRCNYMTHWTAGTYAAAYIFIMLALILSRAIARGVILFSSKSALASYARNASQSYVVGYVVAASAAIMFSIFSSSVQIYTSLILVFLMFTTIVVSKYIEKRTDTHILLPVLAQATLLSLIQPWQNHSHLIAFLVSSTCLGLLSYLLADNQTVPNTKHVSKNYLTETSLATLFITPLAVLFVGTTVWPMPLGLLVAGAMALYHTRSSQQSIREMAGAIISLSIAWYLGFAGVHQLQAYTHIAAATFGIYAYWRYSLGQITESDNYLVAMLAVATIPLAFQAIGGQAGGLYGWWLLLEQVVFMLLGMAIRKRFVTFWGLYVAVAAVLYQLRHLGWLALTLLASFLIGLAIYQLQRHNDTHPEPPKG